MVIVEDEYSCARALDGFGAKIIRMQIMLVRLWCVPGFHFQWTWAKSQPPRSLVVDSSSSLITSWACELSDLRAFRMPWAFGLRCRPRFAFGTFCFGALNGPSSCGCNCSSRQTLERPKKACSWATNITYLLPFLLADNEHFCLSFCAARAVADNPAKHHRSELQGKMEN